MDNKLRRTVDRGLAWVLIVLMAANVLNVLWQIFTRFVLQNPSSFTEELARYLLIWLALFGAGYVTGQKLHLAIDVVVSRLAGRWRSAADLAAHACVFLFALLTMVVGGIRLVYVTLVLDQTSAALQIGLGYIYLAVPLSGLVILFYTALFLTEQVAVLAGRRPPMAEAIGGSGNSGAPGQAP